MCSLEAPVPVSRSCDGADNVVGVPSEPRDYEEHSDEYKNERYGVHCDLRVVDDVHRGDRTEEPDNHPWEG